MKKIFLVLFLFLGTAFSQTFDGPAELPRSIPSVVSVSPNPSKIIGPSDNLQEALNTAVCGDYFSVHPSLLITGVLILPTLACDDQHWITITNGNMTALDAPIRIHPSVPMPKITGSVKSGLQVRFIGFEVTRTGTGVVTSLIIPGSNMIYDRLYVHGSPTTETVRGINLSNSVNVAIINSWFSDFHCLAVAGACGDAQAIVGGLSNSQDGNYLIQNNYLEASGENILFGGGSATVVPTNITIRYNDFAKPDSWNPSDSSYAPVVGKDGLAHPWIVKNLFELKNAQRVLVEGNRMVGSWGGFTQAGTAILMGPKNQAGANGTNLCSICSVEDVTFRNNWISKTGGALVIGYGASDNGGWPTASDRFSIHDNQFDRLQYATCSQCTHYLIQIGSGYDAVHPPPSVLHDVSIKNNVFYLDGTGWLPPRPTDGAAHGFLIVSAPPGGIFNIVYENNVQPGGSNPISSTGGGSNNCFTNQLKSYSAGLALCWTGSSSFTGNVIFTQGSFNTTWPAGNYPIPVGSNQNTLQLQLGNRKP